VTLVSHAHAATSEEAMVVTLEHTASADEAVMCAWGAQGQYVQAHPAWVRPDVHLAARKARLPRPVGVEYLDVRTAVVFLCFYQTSSG